MKTLDKKVDKVLFEHYNFKELVIDGVLKEFKTDYIKKSAHYVISKLREYKNR